MNKSEKNFDTGLRILEVLKILLSEDITKNELINKLKDNDDIEGVYTQEAFLKYFNTFEHFGLKLKREKNKYCIDKAFSKVDLTKKEQSLLVKLIENIGKLNNKKYEEIILKLILKINKYVDIDLKAFLSEFEKNSKSVCNANVKANIISTLKNMLYDNQKVDITYKKNDNTNETLTVELKEIIENQGCVYIVCYNNIIGRNKKINIDNIISLKQLPNKTAGCSSNNTVVFEIYGRLAALYKLRQNEKLLNFGNNYQTISNSEEDKDALLLRLLKYGENCKIIRPLSMRQELFDLTNKILENLEENQCQK